MKHMTRRELERLVDGICEDAHSDAGEPDDVEVSASVYEYRRQERGLGEKRAPGTVRVPRRTRA